MVEQSDQEMVQVSDGGSSGSELYIDDGDVDDVAPMLDNGRLRMRPDIEMKGAQYSGRKSSRLAAFDGLQEDLVVRNTELELKDEPFGRHISEDGDDDILLGSQRAGSGDDDQLDALKREYEELRKEEEETMQRLKGYGTEDQGKGVAVFNQKGLWDTALEMRIAMQKLVTGANQLLRVDEKLRLCGGDIEIEKAYSTLAESASAALDGFLDLKNALIEQNDAVPDADVAVLNETQKREREKEEHVGVGEQNSCSVSESLWDRMQSLYSRIVPYRNISLDRWQRKTQLSTGAAAVRGKLRAFNKSITQQMEAALRDPSQLIDNIRSRQPVVVFGQVQSASVNNGRLSGPASLEGNEEVKADVGNPELLDDSDFYQQLLLEFLESADANGSGGFNLHSIKKMRVKRRKIVDRRASKGRKIRYTVHEPIVNFMAPEPMVLPSMAPKLFGNLFGQRTAGVAEPVS